MDEFRISMEAARVNARMTQKELAKRLGISTFTIRNWENGVTSPTIEKFNAFCETVGVSPTHISLRNNLC
jgi:DNA-binding XRE family transcriptional regulator